MHQNHLDDLFKHISLCTTPRISDPASLGWGPGICVSNKFPGDINDVISGTTI